ncbi:porin [Polynucleobacter sp. P1-05-14]|uniref:porin n=1 Tax=Polynucleobacter sp. P1-05-14 TaxID=1819732 RepID=UPI001C0DA842|nr:porin [Polynucleobacter sp. P1-05-14]MBU3547647.1 porin [Polynucleobacter sp. P1-05-14]
MKKSLLAVAAIGAFASAAQAQSSVTVYGILDVGYIGGNTSVQNSAGTAGYNQGTAKSTVSQFGQGAEQTNRLGFKGVEDLGGGTSAFFTAEFYLYPQDQTLSGNTAGGLNNRQTFVGLKKNGIGQTAIGLQYTPIFNAAAATDVGQLNNMTGNVIYAGSTGITSGQAGTNNLGFTNRTANTLSVKSDTFAGFSASAIYTLNNKNQTETGVGTGTTTGGNTNASGWGIGADYTHNKFYITAAYQALKQLTTSNDVTAIWANQQASGATAAPVAATAGSISGTASNVQDNQFYAGTTYDFGILKAYAQYVSRKATDTLNTNYYGKRSAEQIGVRAYITPTIEAWGSAGLGRYTTFGTTQPTANFSGWQLGSNYYLSKRTNLYAIYGSTVTSTANTANGATVGGSMNNYAVGVRHTF